MNILITGAAGFIGSNLCLDLVKNSKYKICGVDNLNNYYDVNLKRLRVKEIKKNAKNNFKFFKIDISNKKAIEKLFKLKKFDVVVNLAAQAGVRYSLIKPREYIKSNILGFFNILEFSKNYKVKHLLYASTSSVYGKNNLLKLKENDDTDHPLQLYAATKKSNELMAHSFSNLYSLKTTGLRFFTVYGEWGRPDMALFKFVKNIILKKKIEVYNKGYHFRDFTHVSDVVKSITILIKKKPKQIYNIFNIGNSKPVNLMDFISIIEKKLNKKAIKKMKPMQKGDVLGTNSNSSKLYKFTNYKPNVDVKKGIGSFIEWYIQYYK